MKGCLGDSKGLRTLRLLATWMTECGTLGIVQDLCEVTVCIRGSPEVRLSGQSWCAGKLEVGDDFQSIVEGIWGRSAPSNLSVAGIQSLKSTLVGPSGYLLGSRLSIVESEETGLWGAEQNRVGMGGGH